MLSINQKLTQSQKLSPQQIQYQKLLQLSTLALEQRIKNELEQNPLLEEVQTEEEEMIMEQNEEAETPIEEKEQEENPEDEFDIEDFMNDNEFDELPSGKNEEENEQRPVAPARGTLTERLLEQLHLLNLSEDEITLGENIIYSLGSDGYFREDLKKMVDDLRVFDHIDISYEQAEKVLKKIQRLEPVGIASRNLKECLLVQLENSDYDPYYSYLAQKLLKEHFDDFLNKRYEAIKKKMDLTDETLKETISLIKRLNPKPGAGQIEIEEINQITPDFIIEKVGDNYIISLNDKAVPSVTINREYLEMLDSKKRKRKMSKEEKETRKFLREKRDLVILNHQIDLKLIALN